MICCVVFWLISHGLVLVSAGFCSIVVCSCVCFFFFFKQKTAYEMRISDWSSDVCSSDLFRRSPHKQRPDPGTVPAASDHFRMRPVLDHPALPFGHGQGRDEIQRLSAPSQPCTAALIGNGSSCPPS